MYQSLSSALDNRIIAGHSHLQVCLTLQFFIWEIVMRSQNYAFMNAEQKSWETLLNSRHKHILSTACIWSFPRSVRSSHVWLQSILPGTYVVEIMRITQWAETCCPLTDKFICWILSKPWFIGLSGAWALILHSHSTIRMNKSRCNTVVLTTTTWFRLH